MELMIFIYTFIAIFALNLIPIFGPPTWMVLSFITLTYAIPSLPLFVIVALCGSALGRSTLTYFSERILRNRFLGRKYRENVTHLKKHLEKKPLTTSTIFLLEAFTPLPSDQLFVAYGLTGLKLRYAIIPFIIGRAFTYSFWVFLATEATKQLGASSISSLSFLSGPFIAAELVILFIVYLFVRIDWEQFILHHTIRFIH